MTQKQSIVLAAYSDLNESLVKVNQATIEAVNIPAGALGLMPSGLGVEWQSHPAKALAFLIALNSLNYMFWSMESVNGKKTLSRYVFDGKQGAAGMRAAFDKTWGDSIHPDNFRKEPITAAGVIAHFGNIPDPESRATLLSEVFAGDRLEQVSLELVQRITGNRAISADDAEMLRKAFPRAFGDPYLKRAQLAIFWMAGFFAECGIVVDTTDVTAFADYQVPRALRALGILEYSDELASKVDSLSLLDAGSVEERAIRGATVVACEALAMAKGATAAEIDNFLWTNRNVAGATPFHLTFTENY